MLAPPPPPCAPVRHHQEYKETFGALLLEECAAQILRGVEEGEVLSSHMAVVALAEARDDGFLHVRLTMAPGISDGYSDHDLVLLCKDNPDVSLFLDGEGGAQHGAARRGVGGHRRE